ncbi:MAG TPA: ferritin-like domain-containing protein [Actinopolymorphaceae bacterium]
MAEESRPPQIEALQGALAGVHAALWAYGLLTPRLSDPDKARARTAHGAHRRLRDHLERVIAEAEETPVASAAGYSLPFEVTGRASARRLAAHVERGCAQVFGHLAGATSDPERRVFAARALTACARRAVEWGGEQETFPGLTH